MWIMEPFLKVHRTTLNLIDSGVKNYKTDPYAVVYLNVNDDDTGN